MFHNKEFKRLSIIFLFISLVTVIIEFSISPLGGIAALVSLTLIGYLFFSFTKLRYKKIAHVSNQIDRILHNDHCISIDDSEEGELSILQCEVSKMTLRIREQNLALKKEKEHIATSLEDVAHQLRTPLTSVNILLSLLRKSSDEHKRKTFTREIKELLIQMDWLLTTLLKVSRLDGGIVVFKKERINLSHLLSSSVRQFFIPMELHNISLHMKIPENITIKIDPHWFSEGIKNIMKNSLESIGDNGSITIECLDNPLFTEIVIHDSGPGFKKEDLPHIFDRFYRGCGSNSSGYGIGLSLCKKIITGQGGTISAQNHPNSGAVFSIRFPK